MKNKIIKIAIACALFFLSAAASLDAQCPMCRITAESNLKEGGTMGKGLNTGILYMLVMPYLLVACIAFWWWKNRKPEADGFQAVDMEEEEGLALN